MNRELNDKINAYIIWLWEEAGFSEEGEWEPVKDMVNSRYGVKLTRNAVRKRYGRRKESYKDSLDDKEELLESFVSEFDPNDYVFNLETPEEVVEEETVDSVGDVIESTFKDNGLESSDFVFSEGWIRGEKASIRVKRKKVTSNELEELTEWAENYRPDYRQFNHNKPEGKHCLLISIADVHVEDVAWGNISEAEQVYKDSLQRVIERALGMNYNISQIVYPFGQDMGAIDNPDHTTAAGTPQDTSVNFEGGFSARKRIGISSIDFLSGYAPVHVPIVPGNHDPTTNWQLGEIFSVWFRDHDNVEIDNFFKETRGSIIPWPRKYYRWVNNLIMFTHGDQEKDINYGAIMNNEQPKAFGAVEYREVIRGHFHGRRDQYLALEDSFGVHVRTVPSLVPSNQWHIFKGYIGKRRGAMGIVYSYEKQESVFEVYVG